MKKYNPSEIDKKWQKKWDKEQTFSVKEDQSKKKFFALVEFPYPSGAGLHVGHARPFTAMDVVARKKRMDGLNVLYPIGFDAFGLPTENYAIKTGEQPAKVTEENIAKFTRQFKSLGYSFDWSRAVDTTDPKYFKWTQWIFLQMFKHGLAYKKSQPINWCPKDKIGLANEEVVQGCCERCGTPVEQRNKAQWILGITQYAEKLLEGLKEVDYITPARIQQENWIGKSEGAEIKFVIQSEVNNLTDLTVFTTRPDTIFGATYIAVSADLANKWLGVGWQASPEIKKYIEATLKERVATADRDEQEKTGVDAGIKAVNPVSGEEIPVWITNYVMGGVGTGAIMGVPAHDERDFEFAKKFGLPVKQVVAPYIRCTGNIEPQNDKTTTKKNVVTAIIRNQKTKEYLVLYWDKEHCGFVGGAIETGETAEDAIKREVQEETGYSNVLVTQLVPAIFGHGFKPRKDKNCFDFDTVFLVDVTDESKQGSLSPADLNAHEVVWKKEKDLDKCISLDHHRVMWKNFTENRACYDGGGIAINSDFLNDLETTVAKEKIIALLEEKKLGKRKVNYKLRDWVFSRQRYWGEPIPLVYCEACAQNKKFESKGEEVNPGWIPDETLPLELPKIKKYEPTDTGESPLASVEKWVNTKCPRCGGPARRETDTMPNWAGSSWYFLRYTDPDNDKEFASPEKLKYWMAVDWYNGGMEHTVLHLLYSRFWNQFLYDIGVVPTSEPYKKRTSHGMILGPDGEKMSKSRGNVINPDEMTEQFGTDAFRSYIMFMGPFDQAVMWDTNGVVGVRRFLDRVWNLQEKVIDEKSVVQSEAKDPLVSLLHKLIKKVGEDIDAMRFNTAIAKMMEFVNEASKVESISKQTFAAFLQLLSPFAPHMAEELWETYGEGQLAYSTWPKYDAELAKDASITLAVQINGKVRDTIETTPDATEESVKAQVLGSEKVQKWLEGKAPKKVIYIKGKLVSIVV